VRLLTVLKSVLRSIALAKPNPPDDREERRRPDAPPLGKAVKRCPKHVLLGRDATDKEIENALEWL
jgi:hypothetical protein